MGVAATYDGLRIRCILVFLPVYIKKVFSVSLAAEKGIVDLTRFRGRLTRPNFGAEVAHGIEQEGSPA